jgi:acyl transferase domain-containing protein/acyl carrier protein
LFAVEYSLSQMWMSWGIQPAVMIGHSLGEYAAACVAGVMTLAEALNLVATRGRLTDGLSSDGGMAAVGLSHAEVERRLAAGDSSSPNPAGARHAINGASLRKRLSIAAVNAPDQVVLSGDAAALRDFVEPLAREGVFVHWLEVSHAFHSRHVEPMLAEFGRALESVVWRSPRIPVISNLTGRPADDEIATPEYWRRHLRETVRFQQGMEAAGALADVFLEIGPKPVLLGFGRKILTDRDAAAWLPSLRPPLDDWTTLLDSLCSLATSGVEIDWENFDREYPRRRVSLPTYPFQRKRYWIERPQGGRATIPSKSTPRLDASSRRHPLLHQRWRSPLIAETVFEAEISLEESPFIADHRFFGTAIMPATAYLEMGLCAAGNLFGAGPRALMNVEFSEVLPLEEQRRQRLQLVAGKPEGRRAPFRVISIQEETATANDCRLHVQGELGRADDIKVEAWKPPTVERIGERCPRRISREEFYEAIREHDVFMGELFQVVDECFVGDGELWGRVRIPPGIADRSSFDVPPPILDACLQLIPGGVPYDVEMTLLPVGIERLAFHGALGDAGLWCRAVLRTDGATGDKVVVADAWLIDDAGRCCVSLEGLQYRRVMKDSLRRRIQPHSKNLLFRTAWRPLSLASTVAIEESPKRWLIVGGDTDVAARLFKLLTQAGHECVTAAYGETFRRLGACRFELPWNDRAAWDQLLSETAGIGSRPYDGVIHLVGLDDGCGSSDGDVAGVLRRGCESLLYLAQGLLSGGWSNLPPLTIVTRGGQAVNGSADVTRPTSTALWGFGRALEMEHSEWACLRIDLGSNDAEGDASRIVAEIMSGDGDRESAYRDGERFVPRVEPLDRREYRLPEIRDDRTYLITGGSGALGLKTAHWLIEQGARHLVLASRFGARNAEEGILAQWRAHGVGATSLCCDVSREEDVARLFAQIDASMPALAGIIHAAGVLDDGALENLDWRRFERVLAAKVFGAWHLHRLSEGRTLDFFVCYSSIASVLGSAGQANYAAANAFLDGLAHLRQSRGLRTLSVQWGPWAGGGMAEGLSETIRRRHEQRGLILFDDAEAFDALADLWQRGAAEGLVLAVDWERYRRQFVGGRPQPLLEIVAPAVSESSPEKDAFRRHWTEAADYERRALVEELTRRLVGAAVGFDEIGADDSFFDLGLDSLASVQLRNDLQEYLGLELPATFIFMHPTLDQLNRYLTEDVLALDSSMASGRVNGDNFIADNIAIPKEDANSLEVLSDGELAERLSSMLAALQSESA